LLRSSFEGTNLIPDDILWRKKMGFGAALAGNEDLWFKSSKFENYFERKVRIVLFRLHFLFFI